MGQRYRQVGTVVSDVMDKTIVVSVERRFQHPLYKRIMKKTKKYMAHDEKNEAKVGNLVEITEDRPRSARKRWALTKIIE
jgi:small subunit ribosomal protein S17